MTIAVTGATGQLGRLVIEGLKEKGAEAIALVRDPAKADGMGVPARKADYDQPDTLAPALEGVDTLLLISGSEIGQRARQHKAVIDAAKTAGVKRIVYTSLLNAPTSTLSLADEHRATEAMLAERLAAAEASTSRSGGTTPRQQKAPKRPPKSPGSALKSPGKRQQPKDFDHVPNVKTLQPSDLGVDLYALRTLTKNGIDRMSQVAVHGHKRLDDLRVEIGTALGGIHQAHAYVVIFK